MKGILEDIKTAMTSMSALQGGKQKFRYSDLKFLKPYINDHWKAFLLGSLFLALISLISMPAPLLMKYIIDTVIPLKNYSVLHWLIFALIGLHLVKIILSFVMNYIFNKLNQKILLEIRKDLFTRILKLPLSFFDKNQTGYIMSRIGEVNQVGVFFSSTVTQILISVCELIVCVGILVYMNWILTIISVIMLPFYYLVARSYGVRLRGISRQLMEKGAKVSKHLQESISGVDTVKIFSAEKREATKFGKSLNDLMQSNILQSLLHTFSGELLGLVGIIGMYLVLWYGSIDIMKENFTIGGYIAFSAYLTKLYSPTQMLASFGLTIQPSIIALNRVSELFNIIEENEGGANRTPVTSLRGKIEFNQVYFSYEENRKEVFKNLNIVIHPGEKVAIIGPNGSGKSTFIKLILGLYPISKGRIFIDDQDLNSLIFSDLRERIGVVSQNIFLFNTTLIENIRYSVPDAENKQVFEASKLAGAYDFINELEKGFDTVVGETGKTLSGGERQKIAIARAILKNADIIIFDEATSNLDKESVNRINSLINNSFKEKTVLIIAHNMIDLNSFDKVINLGEISVGN